MHAKSVLVIGLGRFGRHTAIKFAELGHEVLVIDVSEERVEEVMPYVTSGEIGDCTNEQVLESLGVRNFDLCVVGTGSNFQSSLIITSMLGELGAKYIIAKANRDIHAKLLSRNGADKVVYPEREMGERIAREYGERKGKGKPE